MSIVTEYPKLNEVKVSILNILYLIVTYDSQV